MSATVIADPCTPGYVIRDIDGVLIHDAAFAEATESIWAMVHSGCGGYVVTPNIDYVARGRRDEAFRSAINSARLRVPDGMWVVYASRIAGRPLRETVTGRLLLPALARKAAAAGCPIALFGAPPGVAATTAEALKRANPTLEVSIALTPPMGFVVGGAEDDEAGRSLAVARPALLFVALGAPKQELWMQLHADHLPGTMMIGVGAAFDIVSGRFREAPRWMTRVGLEWLFRLAQEPRRLARRYLIDDPRVIAWACRRRLFRK